MNNNRDDYTVAGRVLLGQAFDELAQRDLRQASEKGWGAAAQMVKAVAEQRGWEHNRHALLFEVVRRIAGETGNNQLNTLFHFANSLHTNFYENWLPEEMVRSGLDNLSELVDTLEFLLNLPEDTD
jgi:hypothetical protein